MSQRALRWSQRLIVCGRALSAIFIGALLLGGCAFADVATSRTKRAPPPPTTPRPRVANPSPRATPQAPLPAASLADWLVLFYFDADDDVIEKSLFIDLNEIERVGSTHRVHLVAQIDRYRGGFRGGGNWSKARRYYLTQDPDLKKLNSPLLADLGEVNMADGDTLVDFVVWAIQSYPARGVALILSDHGLGWPGGFSDMDSGGNGPHDLALAEMFGDSLWLMELDDALTQIARRTGRAQLDLIGLDACLMGALEVYATLAPHARYVVASEEVEPDLGWAYASFLMQLAFDPEMDAAAFAQAIVDSYIFKDEVITDDDARQEFIAENLTVKRASAEDVARLMSADTTLSAVESAALPDLLRALDDFVYAIARVDQNRVAKARAYAQAFENALGDEGAPSPYIDLGHFVAMLLDAEPDQAVRSAGERLLAALDRAVVAEKHGEERPGATGVSLYFPTFDLYKVADNLGYRVVARRFARMSQWDEYLEFHFTNRRPRGGAWAQQSVWQALEGLAQDLLHPDQLPAERPGARPPAIDPLVLSADTVVVGSPITITTTARGAQLAYLYSFLGQANAEGTAILLDAVDFIDPGAARVVNGVAFPEWGGDIAPVAHVLRPRLFVINDGTQAAPALLTPQTYGAATPTYSAAGTYRFANGSPDRYATLIFQDQELIKVLGFSHPDGGGAPYPIVPAPGDQFTFVRRGFSLKDDELFAPHTEAGATLTFGAVNWTWEEQPAPAGTYVVGVIAEDFDGNQTFRYATLTVQDP